MSTPSPTTLKRNAEAVATLERLKAEERALLDRRLTGKLNEAGRTRLRALQWRIAAQRERIEGHKRKGYAPDDIIIVRY